MSQKYEKNKRQQGIFQPEKSAKLLKSFGNSEAYKACPAAQAKVNIRQMGWFRREMRTGVNRNSLSGHMHGNLAWFPVLSQRQPLPALLRMIWPWEWKLPPLPRDLSSCPPAPQGAVSCCPPCSPMQQPLPTSVARSHPLSDTKNSPTVRQKSPSPTPSKNFNYAHV